MAPPRRPVGDLPNATGLQLRNLAGWLAAVCSNFQP